MLELKNISKYYEVAGQKFVALDNISLKFRNNDFVSILGQSGSGKTTMLNIIGGLDKYSSGDLIIKNKSTKEFKEKDWDAYRNHSIGFIFQSYNLIPHQNILSNVELALTLSGVGKKERKQRAIEALEKVGLKDHINKKPAQLSGGQMQRVAIARALINDPEILLADEPTGALDSETSIVIMELLKEIAKDRLVILVTHNPELAKEYSTRIINLKDGKVVSDTAPYTEHTNSQKELKLNKTKMSFFTALGLSFNNLLTKKARTFLTAFAGSIGIIGISLILALSTGADSYIDKVQEDTLTSYPIQIDSQTLDFSGLADTQFEQTKGKEDKITTQKLTKSMLQGISAFSGTTENNLKPFKEHIENNKAEIEEITNSIEYRYPININIYDEIDGEILELNPFSYIDTGEQYQSFSNGQGSNVWTQLISNQDLLKSQYDIVSGKWPESYNEVVLFVNKQNQISDLMLYQLGFKNPNEIKELQEKIANDEDIEIADMELDFDEVIGKTYKYIPTTSFYEKQGEIWAKNEEQDKLKDLYNNAVEIKIVGILRPNEASSIEDNQIKIGYLSSLRDYAIEQVNNSEIGKAQLENQNIDVFSNKEFIKAGEEVQPASLDELPENIKAYVTTLPPQQQKEALINYASQSQSTLEDNMNELGLVDLTSPSGIDLYAKDFESKEKIDSFIEEYNKNLDDKNNEIVYTDLMGLLLSSVTSIINIISYLLIGFVSISLVVSSIMIGIITYVSVLERTKEIGILKAIGARRKDISRVFNAETSIVGFFSGFIGIGITLLLIFVANKIILNLTGVANFAKLEYSQAIALIALSIFLTLIAGIIPSRIASRKNAVEALRTE